MKKSNFIYHQKVRLIGGVAVAILARTFWAENHLLGGVFALFALVIIAETIWDQIQWQAAETTEKTMKVLMKKKG